ncbi:LOB domain-containing protein 24-like [Aristolochia californica]|uniref:LOB domain-containing protein 24-like n=1 Tax=Aristolochia californica TaxID=171875 RepID=UPI0035DF1558
MKSRCTTNSNSPMNAPCAGCKLLRRRCSKDCIFVPYFPSAEPEKFAAVHRIFGASNVSKMLHEIPVSHRGDAVNSLVYEANARLKDPVYGCVASIASLQHQVSQLQTELAMLLAETITLRAQLSEALLDSASAKNRAFETVDCACTNMSSLAQAYSLETIIEQQPQLL